MAAKLLEHTDKKAVHRFRKYFKKVFEKEEYFDKEAHILNSMNFDLRITTFMDYIFHYISKGSCFSSEMLDVVKFEDAII